MGNYDVTVLVAIYEPIWEKLHATLQSVLKQKNIKIQIVVTDDGSNNKCFMHVKDFFDACGFQDYFFVENKENKGTVANIISGLRVSKGEYIKLISPGDLLYDELTMKKWLDFAAADHLDITFSAAVFYRRNDEDGFQIVRHKQNPNNIKAFVKPLSHIDRVINYLLLEDGISGATLMLRKKVLEHYLSLLNGRVIYAEDFFLRLAVLERVDIKYYPVPGIWYEYGDGGISTTPNSLWQERMRIDAFNMGELCLERYDGTDSRIVECINEYCRHHDSNGYSRFEWWCKLLCHPRWLYWKIQQRLFSSKAPIINDDIFLRYCFADGEGD